ncbi:TonB-dependent receptor domain-containing protein [Henriciella marina]|uniref:TonB-dependent receptor domain-containing protein n=1 Tax=Henriciella marina TaxID=453851 RepID=UPI00036DF17B|nr:TonB-dependent receptor [Henriciella marina]
MNANTLKKQLLTSAVFAGAAMTVFSAPAFAQDDVDRVEAPASVEAEARQQTVVVTGSLIPSSSNLTSTSPVTEIGAEQFDIRGTVKAEDLINTLPQAFGAQGSNLANGGTGTASINLRGLGSSRTLVLMNGRRLPYGSLNIAAPDINSIPTQLVERVDVLTGGASATYGSDAISGVVNFVMNDDFEGFRIDGNYSFFQHNNDGELQGLLEEFNAINPSQYEVPSGSTVDGETVDITIMAGGAFDNDRGHATAFASYSNANEVLQGDRDYSQCALSTRNSGNAFTCSGSATNQFTNLLSLGGTLPDGSWARVNPNAGTFIPRDFVSDTFNFNPFNHFQRPNEKYTFGTFLNYDISDNIEAYGEFMFVQNETNSQIAPSGVFGYGVAGGNGGLNCDNPFLSAQQKDYIGCNAPGVAADAILGVGDFLALRRNVEGGPRNQDIRHQTFRNVIGIRGDLEGTSVGYDVYASYAKVVRSEVYNNDLSIRKLSNALYAVPDGNGGVTCAVNVDADPVNDDPNCAPYDIWSGNAPSQAALDYIVSPLNRNGDTTQTVISSKLFGSFADLNIASPMATDAPGWAVGAEYRRDTIDSNPDAAYQSGDGAGQGGPTTAISGSQNVIDIFAELDIPLVQERPGIYDLNLDLAYRKSFYDNVDSDAYKAGLTYAPTPDFRVRGSYQRAVRAANIFELFSTQSIGLFDLDNGDPCGALPGETPEFTQAQCVNTGLDPANYGSQSLINPAGQYNTFGGGNPELDPEESDTFTVGFVATPSFLSGLTVSLDYFDIEVEGYINTVPEEVSLQQCGLTGNAFFCGLVNRGAGGTLWAGQTGFITATNVNTGSLATSGYDLQASYTLDTEAAGAFTFDYVGTYLESLEFQALPDANVTPPVDCVGLYAGACQTNFGTGANPDYRHKASVTWAPIGGNLSVTSTWRHYAKVDQASDNPAKVNESLNAQNYLDLSAAYNILENTRVRVGVNNLTDEDPPIASVVGTAPGNGNTYPQVYDALGRYVFFGATVDF